MKKKYRIRSTQSNYHYPEYQNEGGGWVMMGGPQSTVEQAQAVIDADAKNLQETIQEYNPNKKKVMLHD